MDFDFSPEQYGLRDEARRFLEEQCPTAHVREFLDDKTGWSRGLWKQMADLGWMALPFPERFGGLGQGFLDLTLLLGELGRALAPVPFLSSVAYAGHTILAHGDDAQIERFLPPIAGGERVAALALVEADGVYDEPGVRCAAVRDGDAWRLTGDKTYVLDAPAADLFVVAARASDGIAWFVVDEALDVAAQQTYDRTRKIGSIALRGVAAERLARPGIDAGWRYAVAATCAEMIGVAQRILDMSVDYAKVREQFGRPIGSFQAIKHKLAEMATELEAARAAAFYACWAVASDAPDAGVAVSIAKSYCSDQLAHLAGEGVQVHGGIAFTWEHDMQLYLKRMKTLQVLFGDGSFHRERIARLVDL